MQIFRKKFISLLSLQAFILGAAFCQSFEMPEMPSMPEISTSIDFPEIELTSSGQFYTPSVPVNSISPKAASSDSQTKSEKSETSISASNSSTSDLLSSLLGTSSSSLLTASDISSLYDSGLFDDVSSLETNSSLSSTQNSVLLTQILQSLNELKAEQKNQSESQKKSLENYQQDLTTFKKREPSILRFKINGYDIKDSLTTVFFSDTEPDGTFLLSADRKYYLNQKPLTETFYILFKTQKSDGAILTFNVEPSIVQDTKNTNSFVYKFAQLRNLTADKTGNLVVLKYTSKDISVDLLLDIDGK